MQKIAVGQTIAQSYGFVAALPIVAIELVVAAALFGTLYADLLSHISDPKAPAEQLRQSQQYIIQSEMTYMPYLWAVGFIMSPVIYGLGVRPGVFAYRALVQDRNDAGVSHPH
jgi:hypothetical protein